MHPIQMMLLTKLSPNPPIEANKQLVSINWDRTHSLNFTITAGTPGDFIASFIGKLRFWLTLYTISAKSENRFRK